VRRNGRREGKCVGFEVVGIGRGRTSRAKVLISEEERGERV